jgi:hypothetical protein
MPAASSRTTRESEGVASYLLREWDARTATPIRNESRVCFTIEEEQFETRKIPINARFLASPPTEPIGPWLEILR